MCMHSIRNLQIITMLSEDFKGEIRAADIHISPDGKFLYGSNRGDANEIVIYSINTQSGKLKLVGRQPKSGSISTQFYDRSYRPLCFGSK